MTRHTRRVFCTMAGAAFAVPAVAVRAHENHRHPVQIHRFKFQPEPIEINSGDWVIWENRDVAPHTATSDEDLFDTGELGRGDTAAQQFNTPGRYDYFCAFHPHMKGAVIVRG